MSERRQTAALKGRKRIAQGKAQRRPGFASPISQALKGRHNFGSRLALAMRGFCFALTGLDLFLADEARALPGLSSCAPLGLGKEARRE